MGQDAPRGHVKMLNSVPNERNGTGREEGKGTGSRKGEGKGKGRRGRRSDGQAVAKPGAAAAGATSTDSAAAASAAKPTADSTTGAASRGRWYGARREAERFAGAPGGDPCDAGARTAGIV